MKIVGQTNRRNSMIMLFSIVTGQWPVFPSSIKRQAWQRTRHQFAVLRACAYACSDGNPELVPMLRGLLNQRP